MRIGIDVGGTNTDAVLIDRNDVVAWYKTATTAEVGSGIIEALRQVMAGGGCAAADISAVMIGTTHFTNAVVERRRLLEVAAIRIALPATQALPPMIDWPYDLRDVIGNHHFFVHGGHEFNGTEISPLDRNEIEAVGARLRELGIRSVALSAAFSPVDDRHEREVANILGECIPGLMMSLSSEIGRIGLLERENATILNACLAELAIGVVSSFRSALDVLGITAPFYISQNDGTLMNSDFAERYPILTFASGPTNSMRGAAFLTRESDAVVVDIGGTTSDIGMLVGGFPRDASAEVEIANIRTNFRMPDIVSVGLGGGSIVRSGTPVTVGPDSVGYELARRGLVFGGDTLTATDIAVAAGVASVGDPARVAGLDAGLVESAYAEIQAIVERAIDKAKTSAGDVAVILVGGGSILVGDRLAGALRVVVPDHASVANAIGAAIAQVGAEVDQVYSLEGTNREAVLAEAREEAIARAVAAGAAPSTVVIVDVDEIPLTYLPGNATRLRVKAVGDLEVYELDTAGPL